MFSIIQSNNTAILAEQLSKLYKDDNSDIFDEFVVIVPAKVLEGWLKQQLANKLGISTLFTTQFWGQYEWDLVDKILTVDADYIKNNPQPINHHPSSNHPSNSQTPENQEPKILAVPKQAVLSGAVIRWKLFSFLGEKGFLSSVKDNPKHVLYYLLSSVDDNKQLWQLCERLAKLYVSYLTERNDWLTLWAKDKAVNVDGLVATKDAVQARFEGDMPLNYHLNHHSKDNQNQPPQEQKNSEHRDGTPQWLIDDYKKLEQALRFLWHKLFKSVYELRLALHERFWQTLDSNIDSVRDTARALLPHRLYLFTVQQLPQIELDFLKRLSQYTDVVLLHFNPSLAFWADIVDKNWLLTQQVIRPQSVHFKDYGHALLSRLGKSSRETFAMLAELSGGENSGSVQVVWQDVFDEPKATTLLSALKQDILMLEDTAVEAYLDKPHKKHNKAFDCRFDDTSLQIHNCHSLKRELEIARIKIAEWLNGDSSRKLSDVVVMLPDIDDNHELICAVFGQGEGIDGLTLPANITGVTDEAVDELWQAIVGIYKLYQSRFYREDFYQWLMTPSVYENFGLSFDMAYRASELLTQAGFVRGFDEYHLKQNLHKDDNDYRRTLAFALDRLVMSLLIADGVSDGLYRFDTINFNTSNKQNLSDNHHSQPIEKTQTIDGVGLQDKPIIQALCDIFLAIAKQKDVFNQSGDMLSWLKRIENEVINRYFYRQKGTYTLNSIFNAMNAIKLSVLANDIGSSVRVDIQPKDKSKDKPKDELINLPLQFVLDALGNAVRGQQIAAEVSGAITFGRFGSLRGISFGLVVMLGMNLSAFPRVEPSNYLDLRKAGLPRRGDRVSEDDDNGAFLEALLQAQDSCFIFYSGQSSTDNSELLPAPPVGELIDFLVSTIWEQKAQSEKAQSEKQQSISMEEIKAWLVTKHTALPFLPSSTLMPPIWQRVYEKQDQKIAKPALASLLSNDQIQDIINQINAIDQNQNPTKTIVDLEPQLTANDLIGRIKTPAKAYLKNRLHIIEQKTPIFDEPLLLSGLDRYAINQIIFEQKKADDIDKNLDKSFLYYNELLPAGVARQVSYEHTLNEHKQWIDFAKKVKRFDLNQALNTTLKPTAIELVFDGLTVDGSAVDGNATQNKANDSNAVSNSTNKDGYTHHNTVRLIADLPNLENKIWYHISTDSFSVKGGKSTDKRLIDAYIQHLLWQAISGKNPTKADHSKAANLKTDDNKATDLKTDNNKTDNNKTTDNLSIGSYWYFKNQSHQSQGVLIGFKAMEQSVAINELKKWVILACAINQFAIILPIRWALEYAHLKINPTEEKEISFSNWVEDSSYYNDSGYISENSSKNIYWQILLGDNDPIKSLKDYLPIADNLYKNLQENLVIYEQ